MCVLLKVHKRSRRERIFDPANTHTSNELLQKFKPQTMNFKTMTGKLETGLFHEKRRKVKYLLSYSQIIPI